MYFFIMLENKAKKYWPPVVKHFPTLLIICSTYDALPGYRLEAVLLFRENRERIDLIIMDVVMPRKNGKEVYDEVRNADPDMKVLFASGYTGDVVLDKGVEDTVVDFIRKPIMPAEFLRKVREVLDG
jgi:CheY-like chemotaxis protein